MPLWEHTPHVHAATPAQPFISLQPHAGGENSCFRPFFVHYDTKKPVKFWKVPLTLMLLLLFFNAQQLKSSLNPSLNRKNFARHASLPALGLRRRRFLSFPAQSTTKNQVTHRNRLKSSEPNQSLVHVDDESSPRGPASAFYPAYATVKYAMTYFPTHTLLPLFFLLCVKTEHRRVSAKCLITFSHDWWVGAAAAAAVGHLHSFNAGVTLKIKDVHQSGSMWSRQSRRSRRGLYGSEGSFTNSKAKLKRFFLSPLGY